MRFKSITTNSLHNSKSQTCYRHSLSFAGVCCVAKGCVFGGEECVCVLSLHISHC